MMVFETVNRKIENIHSGRFARITILLHSSRQVFFLTSLSRNREGAT